MATNPNNQPQEHEKRPSRLKWLLGLLGLVWISERLLRWLKVKSNEEPAAALASSLPASSPRKGYEVHDANARWILGIVVFLFVAGISIHFILGGFLGALKRSPLPADPYRPVQAVRPLPSQPFPHLQVSPPLDLKTFREREDSELNTYGWINRTSGIVRIPIERAMDLVLQKGFPVRTRTNENQRGPSTYQLMQQRPERREQEIKGVK